MKRLSRIALCLPLLMLTIEHAPEGNTYSQANDATSQDLWGWRLTINTSSASAQDDFTGERIPVNGTTPPEMAPPNLWPGDGGGDGGGVGGGSGGGTAPTPTQPPEEDEEGDVDTPELCIARAAQIETYCKQNSLLEFDEVVNNQCPLFFDLQIGGGPVVIFGSITVRSYDHCMNVAISQRDLGLNSCETRFVNSRVECLRNP